MCTLYDRIIALCNEKGVSGSRMCLDLGLSKSTLSDIKNGRKKGISTKTAQKIASYFGISVGYLLGEETEKAPAENDRRILEVGSSLQLTDTEKLMIQKFRKLDERGQAAVLNVLNHEYDSLPGEKAHTPAKEA